MEDNRTPWYDERQLKLLKMRRAGFKVTQFTKPEKKVLLKNKSKYHK